MILCTLSRCQPLLALSQKVFLLFDLAQALCLFLLQLFLTASQMSLAFRQA
eukprot:CAMPEP_0114689894 /NCGR_PEP_ID=MMETSP0191-20121206/65069_1 /TAXON_ID=126664 /ORGANISM="Sorites sp." /LENGTH=50 /DNA_ID=CAMNT_0001979103 /DNA_START=39 /DNA_END=187 /DNA_ORIENTATION=-